MKQVWIFLRGVLEPVMAVSRGTSHLFRTALRFVHPKVIGFNPPPPPGIIAVFLENPGRVESQVTWKCPLCLLETFLISPFYAEGTIADQRSIQNHFFDFRASPGVRPWLSARTDIRPWKERGVARGGDGSCVLLRRLRFSLRSSLAFTRTRADYP